MNIKEELESLKEQDIYSFILFYDTHKDKTNTGKKLHKTLPKISIKTKTISSKRVKGKTPV